MGLVDFDFSESGSDEKTLVPGPRERASDAAGPLLHVIADLFGHVGTSYDVTDSEPASRFEDTGGFAEDASLVGRKVDHAVRDHDID